MSEPKNINTEIENNNFDEGETHLPPLPDHVMTSDNGITKELSTEVEVEDQALVVINHSSNEPVLVEVEEVFPEELQRRSLAEQSKNAKVVDAEYVILDGKDEKNEDAVNEKDAENERLQKEIEALKEIVIAQGLALEGVGNNGQSNSQPKGIGVAVPEGSANAVTALAEGVSSVASGAVGLGAAGLNKIGDGIKNFTNKRKTNNEANSSAYAEASAHQSAINIGSVESLESVSIDGDASSYRLEQLKNSTNLYQRQLEDFWACEGMQKVKNKIVETAEQLGCSRDDVIQRINRDDNLAELSKDFNDALKNSPDAQEHKSKMEKTVAKWGKDYERTNQDLLRTMDMHSPEFVQTQEVLNECGEEMLNATAHMPLEEGESQSHKEKIAQMIKDVAEKIKEFVNKVANLFKDNNQTNSVEP